MAMYPCLSLPSLSFPSVSGAVCSFDSQYAGLPLKAHTVAVVGTQSGSGTPSPSNPRALNGWSAINIGAAGKNFLETNRDLVKAANGGANTWTDNKKTIGGIEVTLLDDGGINLNGTALSNTVIMLHTRFTVLDYPSTMKMYIGTQSAINGLSFRISSADLPGSQLICTNPSTPITIPDIKMNNADVFIFVNGTTQLTNVKVYPMVLLSTETDTDYEPYNGTTTTIQIGSTVYGGEYDARTGVLTVKNFEFVGDTNLIVSKISVSDNLSTYLIRTSTNNFPNAVNNTIISSHFSRDILSGSGRMAQAINDIYFVIDNTLLSEDTATGFVNWLTTNSVTFVYELATPTTIQLPPCPIDTLEVNNIWADTGDTTLQYIKLG